jgi:hypothetical protein
MEECLIQKTSFSDFSEKTVFSVLLKYDFKTEILKAVV